MRDELAAQCDALLADVRSHLSERPGIIQVRAQATGAAEIELYGEVGWDLTAKGVREALKPLAGRDITIRLNSVGGSVFEGFAIYNILARHAGRKVLVVEAIALSAGAFIAMAADEVVMPTASLMMIHNASGGAYGDRNTMAGVIEVMKRIDGLQRQVFAARSGLDPEEVGAMLDAETWMTAEEAVAKGFADRVDADAGLEPPPPFSASAGSIIAGFKRAPEAIVAMARSAPPVSTPPASPVATEESRQMSGSTTTAGGTVPPATTTTAPPAAATGPEAASLEQLEALAARSGGRIGEPWIIAQMKAKATLDQARDAMIDAVAALAPQRGSTIVMVGDGPENFRGALEDALLHKMNAGPVTERARSLCGRHAMELARACIEIQGGSPGKLGGNVEIVAAAFGVDRYRAEAGMHTTSDFPIVLGNVNRRVLTKAFASVPQDWRKVVSVENFEDFRAKLFGSLADAKSLERIGEHGEFKYDTLPEKGEQFGIDSWGKIYAFSRKALINDDLGAIARAMRTRGVAAAKTVAQRVWTLVANGHVGSGADKVVLSDGKAVFHADHGNLAGSGGAINAATMSAARKAMRTQKDLNGDPIGGITPRYLVVSPDKETEAQVFLKTAQYMNTGEVNVFANSVELVVVPWLTGNAWFLFADPEQVDGLVVGFLDGRQEPRLEEKAGWNVEGVEYKVALDFDGAWIDYRGAYRNPGA